MPVPDENGASLMGMLVIFLMYVEDGKVQELYIGGVLVNCPVNKNHETEPGDSRTPLRTLMML